MSKYRVIGHLLLLLSVLIAFTLVNCTKKKEPSPKLLEMQKKLRGLDEEVKAIDAKIKAAPPKDLGLGVKLNADRELAKARFDRMQLQFDALQKAEGVKLEAAPSEEGGHGGGESGGASHEAKSGH